MTTRYTVTATECWLGSKYSNSQWSSWSNETSISYQWYVPLYKYVSWATPPTHCSSLQSQHDEPYHSSHTIIHDHMVYSHSHRVLTWLKILELKMIVMFEGEVNFIPVIRSIVQICLLSNSTNALLIVSFSTWPTVPFESHNHIWLLGIQSQPQSVDLAQNTRTQNDPHVRTRHQFHTSNKEKNKAKMKFTNTTTNTTSITTKTLTY